MKRLVAIVLGLGLVLLTALTGISTAPGERSARQEASFPSKAVAPDAISGSIDEALREGNYPWYDPATGRLQPVVPPRRPWLDWIGRQLEDMARRLDRFFDRFRSSPREASSGSGQSAIGELFVKGLFLAALIVFLVALFNLWSRRGSLGAPRDRDETVVGRDSKVAELPEGVRPGSGDPWAETVRRRAAGDLGGAVVCLFAYQLLRLDRLGLIRLAPGRTGRQYVHTVRDPRLVDSLQATLGLFEDVYYGGKVPATAEFESVWQRAQTFKERADASGADR